jgi:hypothetical protein
LGDLYLDKLNKNHLTRTLVHRLERLGYAVTLTPHKSGIGTDNFHDRRLGGSADVCGGRRAMGFECLPDIGLRDGRMAENSESATGMVDRAGSEKVRKTAKKAVSIR